jgi:transposase
MRRCATGSPPSAGPARPAALGADERLELARLRRKVAEQELEREILKNAADFFARETGR